MKYSDFPIEDENVQVRVAHARYLHYGRVGLVKLITKDACVVTLQDEWDQTDVRYPWEAIELVNRGSKLLKWLRDD